MNKLWVVLLILVVGCAQEHSSNHERELLPDPEKYAHDESQVIDSSGKIIPITNPTMVSTEEKQDTSLPIHGDLTPQEIQDYYPGIVDSIAEIRLFFSEPLVMKVNDGIYVSLLHHHGTFDQMFLCTHDSSFRLISAGYIGNSTMFDGTSHTIEYEVNVNFIESYHVDWGYNSNNQIDTLNHWRETLEVSNSGEIAVVKVE